MEDLVPTLMVWRFEAFSTPPMDSKVRFLFWFCGFLWIDGIVLLCSDKIVDFFMIDDMLPPRLFHFFSICSFLNFPYLGFSREIDFWVAYWVEVCGRYEWFEMVEFTDPILRPKIVTEVPVYSYTLSVPIVDRIIQTKARTFPHSRSHISFIRSHRVIYLLPRFLVSLSLLSCSMVV